MMKTIKICVECFQDMEIDVNEGDVIQITNLADCQVAYYGRHKEVTE